MSKAIIFNDGRFNRLINDDGTPSTFVSSDEVLTQPNLTLSINEVLRRFTSGKPLPDGFERKVVYSSQIGTDDVIPNARKGFDLADYFSASDALKRQIAEGNAKLAELEEIRKQMEVPNEEETPKE